MTPRWEGAGPFPDNMDPQFDPHACTHMFVPIIFMG